MSDAALLYFIFIYRLYFIFHLVRCLSFFYYFLAVNMMLAKVMRHWLYYIGYIICCILQNISKSQSPYL